MRSILHVFCRSPEARQAASDTTAIVTMLTKMWLREGNPESFFAGFIPSEPFIDELPFASILDRITGVCPEVEEEPLKFARVAVGAVDGGFDAIARAGIEGLRRYISPTNLSILALETIRAQSSLLWKLNTFARLEPESGARVPHEFATVSVKVLNVLLLRPEGRRAPIAEVLGLLVSAIHQGAPIHTIAKALESGLMATLINLAQYAYPDVEMSAVISDLIEKDIVPCLVYRSVLKSVGNLKSVYVKRGIVESVRNAWLSFKDLTLERTDMRRGVNDKPCVAKNVSLFRVRIFEQSGFEQFLLFSQCDTSVNLLRCSGCQVARYCSPACQRRDWGTHREYCRSIVESNKGKLPFTRFLKSIKNFITGNIPPGQVMSTIDEDFIKAIMLDDIQRHWPKIRSALEIDPETALATKAIVVKLNYRSMPPVKVKIVPAESTNIGDVPGAIDAIGSCQALMVVAHIRHPQQGSAFSVSEVYHVAAMEKIYIMEREEEEEDAMFNEGLRTV
jgi:hypothetical protein